MVDNQNNISQALLSLSENQRNAIVAGAAGLIAGKLTKSLGSIILKVVGGGFVAIQVLRYFKWIQIDENKLKQDLQNAQAKALEEGSKLVQNKDAILNHIKKNLYMVLSFASGALIGLTLL